jgi:hypothetical protein
VLTSAILALVVSYAIWRDDDLGGVARAAASFALTLTAAYLVFGPSRPDGLVTCDVLSTNLIALAGCAGTGVILANGARKIGHTRLVCLGYVVATSILGIALYLISQPACMAGPLGQLDPGLIPIWLAHVTEVQSVPHQFREQGLTALSYVIYLPAGVAYGWVVVKGRLMRHAPVYFAIFILAAVLGCWQIRLLPYASFLAVPLIALGVQRPAAPNSQPLSLKLPHFTRPQSRSITAALALTVFCAVPAVMHRPEPLGVSAALAAQVPMTPALSAKEAAARNAACLSRDSLKPLARLGKGLAANDIDMGPYIVAHTQLNVMSAPYHRMGTPIRTTHDLFFASASEAKLRMKKMGATYVVICDGSGTTVAAAPVPGDALRDALMHDRAPDFLERIDVGSTPVKVWHLKAD